LARREQLDLNREPRLRGEKRVLSLPEMQRFIVESLPFVGPKLAKQLLKHFGTVERVFTASERELATVEGIGQKRAKEIRRVLTEEYRED
ncbi:MAG TPA: DEAD/DEAH box helicase, partial [Euryarchaeota archaeon]|nr:DEAD/DEAH box helicase [Euryarchaeota archaeon]